MIQQNANKILNFFLCGFCCFCLRFRGQCANASSFGDGCSCGSGAVEMAARGSMGASVDGSSDGGSSGSATGEMAAMSASIDGSSDGGSSGSATGEMAAMSASIDD